MEEPLEGWSQIPELVLVDIISRLPGDTDYLPCLRLVCKGWCSVIDTSTKRLCLRLHSSKGPPPRPLSQWLPGLQQLSFTLLTNRTTLVKPWWSSTSPRPTNLSRSTAPISPPEGTAVCSARLDPSTSTIYSNNTSSTSSSDRSMPTRPSASPWPPWRGVTQTLIQDLPHLPHLTSLSLHEALLPKDMCQLATPSSWVVTPFQPYTGSFDLTTGPSKTQLICRLPEELSTLDRLQELTITASPRPPGTAAAAAALDPAWPWAYATAPEAFLEEPLSRLADMMLQPTSITPGHCNGSSSSCIRMHGMLVPMATLAALTSLTALNVLNTHVKFLEASSGSAPASTVVVPQRGEVGSVRAAAAGLSSSLQLAGGIRAAAPHTVSQGHPEASSEADGTDATGQANVKGVAKTEARAAAETRAALPAVAAAGAPQAASAARSCTQGPGLSPLSLVQLQLLGGVRMLSLAALAPHVGPGLQELRLDLSDLWYVDRLPAALGHCTALTALHLQWVESNQQGMTKVRDLFTHEGSHPFEEGMLRWSSAMCRSFAAMSHLQHFSFNLLWPKGGLNRLQPSGDLYWGELLRCLGFWLGALNHSLTSLALEGQAGLALTAPTGAHPFAQLKSLVIGDCHWQKLQQLAQYPRQMTELVLLLEGEASGGTHLSHEWTLPHLLRGGGPGGGDAFGDGGGGFAGGDGGGGGFGDGGRLGGGVARTGLQFPVAGFRGIPGRLADLPWPHPLPLPLPLPQPQGLRIERSTRDGRRRAAAAAATAGLLLQQQRGSLKRFVCVLDDKRVALKLGQLGLWGCEGLESLVLCLPDARVLPEDIGRLEQLTELVVRLPDGKHQRGLQVPRSLAHLVDLQVLDLSWSGLERLGPEIWDLTSLTALLLGNNQLSALPPPGGPAGGATTSSTAATTAGDAGTSGGVHKGCRGSGEGADAASTSSSSRSRLLASAGKCWSRLEVLSLVNNKLSQLPSTFFSATPALEHLNLACNTLRALPHHLSSCHSLVTLLLAGNELNQLPQGLGTLNRLEVLDLTLNHFEGLPVELSGLSALSQLQLSWNHLREVPQWVGELRSLKVLELGYQHMAGTNGQHRLLLYNDYQDLPLSLTQLHELSHLHLDVSPYMDSSVLDSLRELRGQGVVTGTHRLAAMASRCPYAQEDLRRSAKSYLLRWLIQTGAMWQAGPQLAGSAAAAGAGGSGWGVVNGESNQSSGGNGSATNGTTSSTSTRSNHPLTSSSSSSSRGGGGGGVAAGPQALDRWLVQRWTDAQWLLSHRHAGAAAGGGLVDVYDAGLMAVPLYHYEGGEDSGGEEGTASEDEWDFAQHHLL